MLDLIYHILLARGRCQMVSGDIRWCQVVPGSAMWCQSRWLIENYVDVYRLKCSVGWSVMHRRWCTPLDPIQTGRVFLVSGFFNWNFFGPYLHQLIQFQAIILLSVTHYRFWGLPGEQRVSPKEYCEDWSISAWVLWRLKHFSMSTAHWVDNLWVKLTILGIKIVYIDIRPRTPREVWTLWHVLFFPSSVHPGVPSILWIVLSSIFWVLFEYSLSILQVCSEMH